MPVSLKTNVDKRIPVLLASCLLFFQGLDVAAQGVKFMRDFSPAEGLVTPQESPFREELCINGQWDFQPADVPSDREPGTGAAPELTDPVEGRWEAVKIKIPSPWNVNTWGGGSRVGEGTDLPYAPSSVYFPSYPPHWEHVRMGWLRRMFKIPADWNGKRVILHFEAIMGDYVIKVNGREIARGFGDFLPCEMDITDAIKTDGENELLAGIRDRRLFDRKSEKYPYFRTTYPPGSNTDGLIGIWQDVFLQAVPPVRIADVFVKPQVSEDRLELDVFLINQTKSVQNVSISGEVKEWINLAGKSVLDAPEIKWKLGGGELLNLKSAWITLSPGASAQVTLRAAVGEKLKRWSPETPNLNTLLLSVNSTNGVLDRKAQRFGWREFTIRDGDFYLNGERVQCFGDIQHPFGPYICSRRFAWAWYTMIKDFGGNSVRPHAQPWPRVYYDLADEMGLMVLDETALFGSSLSLNFEEENTWERTARHIDGLVLRDRNHPSVIGWSAGNELFAISLYNKPDKETAEKWDRRIIEIAQRPGKLDPTRTFVTDDGDEDMNGSLPVWSKHFGHGLTLNRLPKNSSKPLIVGESGATYYGKPGQLYPFAGEKVYESYYGRSEALAVDLYRNVVQMARPLLDYFSPSEVCWFGIEHMNPGYSDYSRLPGSADGIFAGLPYEEGKPGYQMERIPPYVSTFNPGLDPDLPLYKPLPMFDALKAALAEDEPQPCEWDAVETHHPAVKPAPEPKYHSAHFIGELTGEPAVHLMKNGIRLSTELDDSALIIVDGENLTDSLLERSKPMIDRVTATGGLIWVMVSGKPLSKSAERLLPEKVEFTRRKASSLQPGKGSVLDPFFELPDLYFSELEGERDIIQQGMQGDFVSKGNVLLEAVNIDWALFNRYGENRKCAQVVLFEKLEKPSGAALVSLKKGNCDYLVSTLNCRLVTPETASMWKTLFQALEIRVMNSSEIQSGAENSTTHDLLLDGPVQ